MQKEVIDDYALPTMLAEKALKEMHWACLDRRYDDAIAFATDAKLYCNVIRDVLWKMKNDGQVEVGA